LSRCEACDSSHGHVPCSLTGLASPPAQRQEHIFHDTLTERAYCTQPTRLFNPAQPDLVCRLNKSMYGLKQAPRAWYNRFASYLLSLGFVEAKSDTSLFIFYRHFETIYLLLYVDDIVITASSTKLLQWIISALQQEFSMKDLGQLHHFLGICVQHQPTGIFLSQRQYTMEIIEREGLVDYKPCTTPVNTLSKLSGYTGDPVSDPTHYSSLVGALQYLTFTRPNLSYVVQQVCLHMHDLRETHMIALRHILRYLQSTLDFGLLHRSSISDLVVYSNADWVGAPTITGPLSGMQSFLVTTSSLGLPSIRTRGISLQCRSRIPGCCQWCRREFFSSQVTHGAALSSDPQHTCLLRQCQCRLLAVQPDSVSKHEAC
jgi:hypothetical protein